MSDNVHVHVHCCTSPALEQLVAQIDDLRTAIGDVSREVSEQGQAVLDAVARVEARVAALGEPDPDLTAELDALRAAAEGLNASQSTLDGLAAATPTPTPEPTPEPAPEP